MSCPQPVKLSEDVALTTPNQFVYGDAYDLREITSSFTTVTAISYTDGDNLDVDVQGSIDGEVWYFLSLGASVRGTNDRVTVRSCSGTPARYLRTAMYLYVSTGTPTVSSVTALAG